MTSARTDLELAFMTPGRMFRDDDGGTIAVRVESLGELELAGVAIGDPLASELQPVTPPEGSGFAGRGRVELAIARVAANDERVAAARVILADRPIAQWVEADVVFGVDAGTAAFASPEAIAGLATEAKSEELLALLDAHDRGGWTWGRVEVEGCAVVAFSSGYGDGIYASYWGLDADGRAVALAIDFDVLIGSVFERFVVPRPRGRGRVEAPALAARGVTLRVPWLRPRWLEVRGTQLPAEHQLHVRLTGAEGAPEQWIRRHFRGYDRRVFRVDLREVPAEAALVVRIVTGSRPLSPA
ncbi:Protein of unknown function [Nannocystis exedens]|uniref:DUF4241 domain-containing protein n=1 Tax=Nannocystis exedens TaxID=54 RepID=A0A1I1VUV3_9BACT|nr:DUF4241 domain-containing protein [Nannocystis exedens]PCC72857.1 hypothetical protein NAEX_05942 [Nannocystis exedens]SFD86615.1 Protein of unknown function [Nannocystis exedens]